MNIVVYGASGMIGQRITQEALDPGHAVTAVIRNPARFTITHPNLMVREGNISDPDDVARPDDHRRGEGAPSDRGQQSHGAWNASAHCSSVSRSRTEHHHVHRTFIRSSETPAQQVPLIEEEAHGHGGERHECEMHASSGSPVRSAPHLNGGDDQQYRQ